MLLIAFGKGDAGMTMFLVALAILALVGIAHALK
jgi:hypothetical protein